MRTTRQVKFEERERVVHCEKCKSKIISAKHR